MMRVACYSYKGGVGRTKVMVGLGALMAMSGQRVGLVDFDLEASGLATIFNADPSKLGRNELLTILARRDLTLLPGSAVDVTPLLHERFGRAPEGNGALKYVPTVSNPELSDLVRFDGETRFVIEDMFTMLIDECGIDQILVDLKPGYSASSGLILPLVHRVVVVARLDSQNIGGLRTILPRMMKRELDPLLVANLVPGESHLAGDVKERIRDLEHAVGHRVDVRIDYDPDVVFDDDFAAVARAASPSGMALATLAELLRTA